MVVFDLVLIIFPNNNFELRGLFQFSINLPAVN